MNDKAPKVKDLFKDVQWDDYSPLGSYYQPILEAFGDIVFQIDDPDYQGDSRVFYEKYNWANRKPKYGILVFGWGSCSGCDALQAVQSEKDANELIEGLYNDVRWFDTKEEVLAFLESDVNKGLWSYHDEQNKRFMEMVRAYLGDYK